MNGVLRNKKSIVMVILLLSVPTCLSAFESSPAGGGCLEVLKPGGYAFVEDHDDFDANLIDEATIEMWIYLKRAPKFRESWVLLHKEGSYLLTLSGHFIAPPEEVRPLSKGQVAEITYHLSHLRGGLIMTRPYTEAELPLNQWHHLAFIFGERDVLYLNGRRKTDPNVLGDPLNDTRLPLYIGGTGVLDSGFVMGKWIPFTSGLIDEVRVSDIARYPLDKVEFTIPHSQFNRDKNTLALWHFDGGQNWLKDASENEHTLTDVDLAYFHVESRGKLSILWGEIKKREAISR